MKIKILGTESLGVRGLSCVVETHDRSIIIDPGVALGKADTDQYRKWRGIDIQDII